MELCLLVTVWILTKLQGVVLYSSARYGTMSVHFRKKTLGTYPCSFRKVWTCMPGGTEK